MASTELHDQNRIHQWKGSSIVPPITPFGPLSRGVQYSCFSITHHGSNSHTSFMKFVRCRRAQKFDNFNHHIMQFPLRNNTFAIQKQCFSRPPSAAKFTLLISQADATLVAAELSHIQLPLSRGDNTRRGGNTRAFPLMPFSQ